MAPCIVDFACHDCLEEVTTGWRNINIGVGGALSWNSPFDAVCAIVRRRHHHSSARQLDCRCVYVTAILVVLKFSRDNLTQSIVPNESRPTGYQTATLLIVILASMIVTLCEHRVNWDDAKYVHNAANALEFPDEPMLVYEHLHGVNDLKIYHPSVRLQTYELTVAAISKVSGMSHLFVYYLLLPPIWAALAVIAQWTLIRRIAGEHAALALIATFILLAVWGGHRSYGAFSFDYVGRGIFLSFAVPALIASALDFAEAAHWKTWLVLFLVTWTGCLLTSTGFAVAPVAICLVLIASYGVSLKKVRELTAGALAFIWGPLLLAYVTWVAPIVTPLDVDTAGGANFVFRGTSGRIALVLFALAPFLLLSTKLRSARWLLRYNALVFAILLSGILLKWIGKYSSILSWRLLWAIPVPVIIGIGISSAINICRKRLPPYSKLRHIVPVVGLALVVAVFSTTGSTVAFRNFGRPVLKMDKTAFPVARSLVQCSKPSDVVLAPPQIAVPMAGLIAAPPLIAVRGHHLSYLTAQWGQKETDRRKRLFNIVQGERNRPEDVVWAREQVLSRFMNRIVLKKDEKDLEPIKEMLRSLKIDHVDVGNWEIWLPKTTNNEALELRSCLKRTENQMD